MQQNENFLSGLINISKVPLDLEKNYSLDKNLPWVNDILIELNENANDRTVEECLKDSELNIELNLSKKFSDSLGEYLLLDLSINAHYFSTCVKTLKEVKEVLEFSVSSAFISDAYQNDPEYNDLTDIYLNSKMYELYFYSKRQASLKDMLHEQIFLNYNQYPVAEE